MVCTECGKAEWIACAPGNEGGADLFGEPEVPPRAWCIKC